MEDEKIIDLYWNRDQGAIGHTAEKYGSYCGRIAKNILLNKEDCEECVNDTWLRAWNAMPDERPAILSAFLGAITRNLVWIDTGNCIRQKEEKGKWSLFLMN